MSEDVSRRDFLRQAGSAVVGFIVGGVAVYYLAPRVVEKIVTKDPNS